MFNDRYGLTQAVLEGRKTMTRRIVPDSTMRMAQMEVNTVGGELTERIKEHTFYCFLDELAVAQSYGNITRYMNSDDYLSPKYNSFLAHGPHLNDEAGWNNKMFVRADLMPHRIRITGIKVERLQDITDDDCLKEGIDDDFADGALLYWWPVPHEGITWEEYKRRTAELSCHIRNGKSGEYFWDTPQKAFASLIDRISGPGTWQNNPYVFAYSFKLVK